MWPTQADLHAMAHFDLALHEIPSAFDAHRLVRRPPGSARARLLRLLRAPGSSRLPSGEAGP